MLSGIVMSLFLHASLSLDLDSAVQPPRAGQPCQAFTDLTRYLSTYPQLGRNNLGAACTIFLLFGIGWLFEQYLKHFQQRGVNCLVRYTTELAQTGTMKL